MIKYPMTVQGAKALEEEHAHLTKVVRPKLSQDIGTARELGDLKENAEYHAAREQQGMVEARIRDIEGRMQNAGHHRCHDHSSHRQSDFRHHR